ncbi:MAG: hypothetical protein WCB19_02530 [Thermoplasmata archaeon]
MNAAAVRIVAQKVEQLGGRYLVVGGLAVEQKVPTATEDVDLLLAVADYERVVAALVADPSVQIDEGRLISGGFMDGGDGKVDFDLLNPVAFAGKRSGEEFFDFVYRSRSYESPLGRTADPQVVWYMRLMVPDWETYIQKIVRDLGNGAPWKWVDDVRRIADRFGAETTVGGRIGALKGAALVAGIPGASEAPDAALRRE